MRVKARLVGAFHMLNAVVQKQGASRAQVRAFAHRQEGFRMGLLIPKSWL